MAVVTSFDLNLLRPGNNGAIVFTESGSAVPLAPNTRVTASGGSFNGQTLTISGMLPEDQIGFAGGVTIVGNTISVGGVAIGTFTGGTGGVDFVVTFNSNAFAMRVQTLLRNLTYLDTSDAPIYAHSLSFNLAGTVRSDAITVLPVNDAPLVDLNGADAGTSAALAYTEGDAFQVIAPSAAVSDADSANFAGGSLRVAFTANGTAADQLAILTDGVVTLTGSTVRVNGIAVGTVSGGANGADLVVSFSAGATLARVTTLMRHIVYSNTSETPLTLDRTVAFTLIDGDGIARGGQDTGVATATISVTDTVILTPGTDIIPASGDNTHFLGTAVTLNSTDDLDGGNGIDRLVLDGAGVFNLNSLAGYAGIEEVQLINFSTSSADLYLRDGTTSVVTTSGDGAKNIQFSGAATATSIQGGDGYDTIVFDAGSWNPGIAIDGGNSLDSLVLNGSNVAIDLQPATLTSIGNIQLSGSNLTVLIDADTLAGVESVFGTSNGNSKFVTAASTLDLTDKILFAASVETSNATGTTFIVNVFSTAFEVYGGPGSDTIQVTTFAFTAAQRDAIFEATSIETIIDTSGTYLAPVPDSSIFRLTVGADALAPSPADLTIHGTAARLNSGDDLDGGAGTDRLVLYGQGSFDLNSLAGYEGIEQVQLINFSNPSADLYLKHGTTSAVITSGSGPKRIEFAWTATATSIQGGDGYDTIVFAAGSWNPAITIDGGNSLDGLFFNGSNATFDLRPAALTSVGQIQLSGSNLTALIDADTLADVESVFGSSNSKLLTAESSLDLTDKILFAVTVESSNATGTTFIVNQSSTAFQVFGGSGSDTIQATTFAFTAAERDAIFTTTSIETIVDTSGTYSNPQANDPPVAVDDVLSSVAEDSGARTIAFAELTGNDGDGDPEVTQALTITAVGSAVGGTVSLDGLGNVLFTPDANFNGTASFDYTLQDNGQTNGSDDFKTDTGSVSFTVTAVNDAPVAVDDVLSSVAEDSGTRTIAFVALTGNDADGDPETVQALTITAVGGAVGGTVSLDGFGNVLFTPNPGFNGAASFDYTLQDNGQTNGGDDFKTDTASVSFTVTAVNDAPVAVDDVLSSVAEDSGTRTIAFAALTGNDTDGDPDVAQALTITAVGSAIGGSVSVDGLGNVVFTPDANFNGTAYFDYTLQDNGQTGGADDFKTDTGSVSFTVTPLNDAPTVANPIVDRSAIEGVLFSFTVPSDTFADADVGDTLALSAALANGDPLPPWLSFDSLTGTFSGTPADADAGVILVHVTASDGEAGATDELALTVIDVVTVNNDDYDIAEFDFLLAQVLTNDEAGATVTGLAASDGTPLALGAWVILPSGARAMLLPDGELRYDPNDAFAIDVGESAVDTLIYTAGDGTATDSAVITLSVAGAASAPVIDQRTESLSGTFGDSGVSQINDYTGLPGGDATAGGDAIIGFDPFLFAGGDDADRLSLYESSGGGPGGSGGQGGTGSPAAGERIVSSADNVHFYYDIPAGNGGKAGEGGDGGSSVVQFLDFVVLGRSGADNIALTGNANSTIGWGGNVYGAGSGGAGVSDAVYQIGSVTYHRHGVPGGNAALAGSGGDGGDATAEVVGASVFGGAGQNSVAITLVSIAGGAGPGGSGGSGGSGNTPGLATDGGDGGDGGDALARVATSLIEGGAGSDSIQIALTATAGGGAYGGQGGWAGVGTSSVSDASTSTITQSYGMPGNGGDGGDGGTARVAIENTTILAGTDSDYVYLYLTLGFSTPAGAPGAAGITGVPGTTVVGETTTITTIAGYASPGAAGTPGINQVALIDTVVDLGDGNDQLQLTLNGWSDLSQLTVSGNTFEGGEGVDTITFGHEELYSIQIDLTAGTIVLGASPANVLLNFENATGSMQDDVIVGSAVANVLEGWVGNDLLIGGDGNDTLTDFAGNDTFVGGNGADHITGGAGNDIHDYNSAAEGGDRIVDFKYLGDADRIDLADIYAGVLTFDDNPTPSVDPGVTAFHVTWYEIAVAETTIVQADVTGDNFVDFSITLVGTGLGLNASDCFL